ncbi:MAG: hypothetical protein MRY21_07515 [Simkaniaceae bacterium]|nr:hypothetical protein [Simkaniaceae bacterium]
MEVHIAGRNDFSMPPQSTEPDAYASLLQEAADEMRAYAEFISAAYENINVSQLNYTPPEISIVDKKLFTSEMEKVRLVFNNFVLAQEIDVAFKMCEEFDGRFCLSSRPEKSSEWQVSSYSETARLELIFRCKDPELLLSNMLNIVKSGYYLDAIVFAIKMQLLDREKVHIKGTLAVMEYSYFKLADLRHWKAALRVYNSYYSITKSSNADFENIACHRLVNSHTTDEMLREIDDIRKTCPGSAELVTWLLCRKLYREGKADKAAEQLKEIHSTTKRLNILKEFDPDSLRIRAIIEFIDEGVSRKSLQYVFKNLPEDPPLRDAICCEVLHIAKRLNIITSNVLAYLPTVMLIANRALRLEAQKLLTPYTFEEVMPFLKELLNKNLLPLALETMASLPSGDDFDKSCALFLGHIHESEDSPLAVEVIPLMYNPLMKELWAKKFLLCYIQQAFLRSACQMAPHVKSDQILLTLIYVLTDQKLPAEVEEVYKYVQEPNDLEKRLLIETAQNKSN